MRKSLLLCLFLLLLLPAAALAEKTTVMVYLCGSNLESMYGSATADLQEMLASGMNPDDVNLVVMAGGSNTWRDTTFSAENLTVAVAQNKSRGSGLRFSEVAFFPNASMGESDTLLTFINFAYMNYPAERYVLILWDHGGGPLRGVCWDELCEADALSMGEVTSALDRSAFGQGEKLYFIGFDACLMGSL